MTVKIYVPGDSLGNVLTPNYPHEVQYIEWMLKMAWLDFHHLENLYGIVANLIKPSADMVVLTQRGLGVLELKNVPGNIKIGNDGVWYSNGTPIISGAYKNPREQVLKYASILREKLLPLILPNSFRKDSSRWNDFKFQTAVCFTNPSAQIEGISKKVVNTRFPPYKAWESEFAVISPIDFTAWIRRLRFQATEQKARKYESVRLADSTIENAFTLVFNCIEWDEMLAAMPPAGTYAYLILEDSIERLIYSIDKDQTTIGRGPDCDITIPERFIYVSKLHCRINRTATGIMVEDLGSTNGTCVEGEQLSVPMHLLHDQYLTLGKPSGIEKHCTLQFKLREKTEINIGSTKK